MNTVNRPRLLISAAQKSSGKTTLSLGILCHLAGQGVEIGSFKKGPDFIDPMWHRLASGRECHNLDPWLMGREGCLDSFLKYSGSAEGSLSLIEGNHGLHDGMALDGSDSSAGLAAMLSAPVLLVMDSSNTNRGLAAAVLGMQMMPPGVTIAGVILNRVRSKRQEEKQRRAIETFCKVPVLGAIPADEELTIPERHLGLTTTEESAGAEKIIRTIASRMERYCDMKAITQLFYEAPPLPAPQRAAVKSKPERHARIGVFRDEAFCFYYPENLNALRESGAELVFIDSMREHSLPQVDGLYLGGGFPESFLEAISSNRELMKAVQEQVERGLPLYAECGGLIYLCRSVEYGGATYPLASVLPFDIEFHKRPAGVGYLDLVSRHESPWFGKGDQVRAHEFHYSRPVATGWESCYQFDVLRGHGITGDRDGFLYRNLFASFAHLHAVGNPGWAERFVTLASSWKGKRV